MANQAEQRGEQEIKKYLYVCSYEGDDIDLCYGVVAENVDIAKEAATDLFKASGKNIADIKDLSIVSMGKVDVDTTI